MGLGNLGWGEGVLLQAVDLRGAGGGAVVGGASSPGRSKGENQLFFCCSLLFVLCGKKSCFFHSVPIMQHTFKVM